MEPKKFNIKESELFDDDNFLGEAENDNENEGGQQLEEQKRVSPEQIRIDSLKLALKIIKMFDKVTAEDLLNVSSLVSSYLINHQAGTEYEATDLDLGGDSSDDSESDDNVNDEITDDDMNFDIEDEPTDDGSENNTDDSGEDAESDDEEETDEGNGLLPDEFVI